MSEHNSSELENHQFLTKSKVAEHELGPKEAFQAGDVDSSWETMGGIGRCRSQLTEIPRPWTYDTA